MSKHDLLSETEIVSRRVSETRREIEQLKAEYKDLVEGAIKSSGTDLKEEEIKKISPVKLKAQNVVKKVLTTNLMQKSSKSMDVLKDQSLKKNKNYDVDETREYMKKQKERRLEEMKLKLKSSENVVELRKQKLKELSKKSLKIVNKCVEKQRERSKSREKNQYLESIENFVPPDLITSSLDSPRKSFKIKTNFMDNITIRSPILENVVKTSKYESKHVKAAITIQSFYKGFKQRKLFAPKLQKMRQKNEIERKKLINKSKDDNQIKIMLAQINKNDQNEQRNKNDSFIFKKPQQIPSWLESGPENYSHNFISAVKRKLNIAINTPNNKTTFDVGVQKSETPTNSQKTSQEIKKIIEKSVKTANNSQESDLKSFLYKKCADLDLKNVEGLKLTSKSVSRHSKVRDLKSSDYISDFSDSDTSNNIPDISLESSKTYDKVKKTNNLLQINEHSINSTLSEDIHESIVKSKVSDLKQKDDDFKLDINLDKLNKFKLRSNAHLDNTFDAFINASINLSDISEHLNISEKSLFDDNLNKNEQNTIKDNKFKTNDYEGLISGDKQLLSHNKQRQSRLKTNEMNKRCDDINNSEIIKINKNKHIDNKSFELLSINNKNAIIDEKSLSKSLETKNKSLINEKNRSKSDKNESSKMSHDDSIISSNRSSYVKHQSLEAKQLSNDDKFKSFRDYMANLDISKLSKNQLNVDKSDQSIQNDTKRQIGTNLNHTDTNRNSSLSHIDSNLSRNDSIKTASHKSESESEVTPKTKSNLRHIGTNIRRNDSIKTALHKSESKSEATQKTKSKLSHIDTNVSENDSIQTALHKSESESEVTPKSKSHLSHIDTNIRRNDLIKIASHKSESESEVTPKTKTNLSHINTNVRRNDSINTASHKSESESGVTPKTKPNLSHIDTNIRRNDSIKTASHKSESESEVTPKTKPNLSHIDTNIRRNDSIKTASHKSESESELTQKTITKSDPSTQSFKTLPSGTASDSATIKNKSQDSSISESYSSNFTSIVAPLKVPSINLQTKKSNRRTISLKSGENNLVETIGNPNQIHVKFEAELHLLNDFNDHMKQFMSVEKSLVDLQNTLNTSKTIYETRDTQTSIVTQTSKTSSKNAPINSINYSRGSIEQGSIQEEVINQSVVNQSSFIDQSFANFDDTLLSTGLEISEIPDNTFNESNRFDDGDRHGNLHAGLSLGMFEQLIKDEDARIENLKTILKIREKALLDRTKGELAWLEVQKKHLLETGQLHEASLVKKKQRGIIIKLQHEKHEMQKLKQIQKAASKERKTILKEQRNMIKSQLSSAHNLSTKIKRTPTKERRNSGPIKVYNIRRELIKSETSISRHGSISEEIVYASCSESQSVISLITEAGGSDQIDCVKDGGDLRTIAIHNQTENAKKSLLVREVALQKRRKAAEDLLKWHQKLLEEERKITELEMAASNIINQVPKAVIVENSVDEKYHFKGSQLNLIWENMTGFKEKKFVDGENYALTQIALERFCKDAKKIKNVLDKTVASEESDKIVSLNESTIQETSIDLILDDGIKQSKSTLNEIMQNISCITDEISELYKLSSVKDSIENQSFANIEADQSCINEISSEKSKVSARNAIDELKSLDNSFEISIKDSSLSKIVSISSDLEEIATRFDDNEAVDSELISSKIEQSLKNQSPIEQVSSIRSQNEHISSNIEEHLNNRSLIEQISSIRSQNEHISSNIEDNLTNRSLIEQVSSIISQNKQNSSSIQDNLNNRSLIEQVSSIKSQNKQIFSSIEDNLNNRSLIEQVSTRSPIQEILSNQSSIEEFTKTDEIPSEKSATSSKIDQSLVNETSIEDISKNGEASNESPKIGEDSLIKSNSTENKITHESDEIEESNKSQAPEESTTKSSSKKMQESIKLIIDIEETSITESLHKSSVPIDLSYGFVPEDSIFEEKEEANDLDTLNEDIHSLNEDVSIQLDETKIGDNLVFNVDSKSDEFYLKDQITDLEKNINQSKSALNEMNQTIDNISNDIYQLYKASGGFIKKHDEFVEENYVEDLHKKSDKAVGIKDGKLCIVQDNYKNQSIEEMNKSNQFTEEVVEHKSIEDMKKSEKDSHESIQEIESCHKSFEEIQELDQISHTPIDFEENDRISDEKSSDNVQTNEEISLKILESRSDCHETSQKSLESDEKSVENIDDKLSKGSRKSSKSTSHEYIDEKLSQTSQKSLESDEKSVENTEKLFKSSRQSSKSTSHEKVNEKLSQTSQKSLRRYEKSVENTEKLSEGSRKSSKSTSHENIDEKLSQTSQKSLESDEKSVENTDKGSRKSSKSASYEDIDAKLLQTSQKSLESDEKSVENTDKGSRKSSKSASYEDIDAKLSHTSQKSLESDEKSVGNTDKGSRKSSKSASYEDIDAKLSHTSQKSLESDEKSVKNTDKLSKGSRQFSKSTSYKNIDEKLSQKSQKSLETDENTDKLSDGSQKSSKSTSYKDIEEKLSETSQKSLHSHTKIDGKSLENSEKSETSEKSLNESSKESLQPDDSNNSSIVQSPEISYKNEELSHDSTSTNNTHKSSEEEISNGNEFFGDATKLNDFKEDFTRFGYEMTNKLSERIEPLRDDKFDDISAEISKDLYSDDELCEEAVESKEPLKSDEKLKVDVKKRVSEILADSHIHEPKGDKSPRVQDLYCTTYDLISANNSPEAGSPVGSSLIAAKAFYEAEELRKKQLAIEQEIQQLEQQQKEQLPYLYIREIPNKPPPPYKPPVQSLTPTPTTVLPTNIEEIQSITPQIANILYEAYLNKELNSALLTDNLTNKLVDRVCFEFVFDLCKGMAIEHYKQFEESNAVSWMITTISKTIKKPLNERGLCDLFDFKLKDLFGFEKVEVKESMIIKWSRKKRDHVDELLVLESQAEESEWTNYDQDELIVKHELTNDILNLLLAETAIVFETIVSKKYVN